LSGTLTRPTRPISNNLGCIAWHIFNLLIGLA
jgi:hypothetical protein